MKGWCGTKGGATSAGSGRGEKLLVHPGYEGVRERKGETSSSGVEQGRGEGGGGGGECGGKAGRLAFHPGIDRWKRGGFFCSCEQEGER